MSLHFKDDLTVTGNVEITGSLIVPSNTTLFLGDLVVRDTSDNTKLLIIAPGGTTATTSNLVTTQTTNITLTLPDATDTLIARDTTDTLTNKII